MTRASAREILASGISHCPEGRRVFPDMIDKKAFGRMKPDAILINTARGGIMMLLGDAKKMTENIVKGM